MAQATFLADSFHVFGEFLAEFVNVTGHPLMIKTVDLGIYDTKVSDALVASRAVMVRIQKVALALVFMGLVTDVANAQMPPFKIIPWARPAISEANAPNPFGMPRSRQCEYAIRRFLPQLYQGERLNDKTVVEIVVRKLRYDFDNRPEDVSYESASQSYLAISNTLGDEVKKMRSEGHYDIEQGIMKAISICEKHLVAEKHP